jgi:hypothetical protein
MNVSTHEMRLDGTDVIVRTMVQIPGRMDFDVYVLIRPGMDLALPSREDIAANFPEHSREYLQIFTLCKQAAISAWRAAVAAGWP